jgi:glyoxylase-like metal-dependent hydrolase (beta-lactamase superfamily II)
LNDKVVGPGSFPTLADLSEAEPRFYRFSLGAIDCVALSDGGIPTLRRPDPSALPTGPDNPPAFTLLPLSILLVRLPASGQLVLIDTGFGAEPIMGGGPAHTVAKLSKSLDLAGFKPDDIDVVLISHMHPDHIGGMYTPDGTKRFPKADYYLGAEELAFWNQEPLDLSDVESPPAIKEQMTEYSNRMLAQARGDIRTFRAGEDVLPGVQTILVPGHSPGQVGFIFTSDEQKLLYTADAFNRVQSIQTPDAVNPMDMNSRLGIETRHNLLRLLSGPEWKNFTPHFPWPSTGRVSLADGSYRWDAIN